MNSAMTKRLERLERKSGTTIEAEIEKLPYAMKLAILKRVREEIAAQKATGFDVEPNDGDHESQKIGLIRYFRDEYLTAAESSLSKRPENAQQTLPLYPGWQARRNGDFPNPVSLPD